MQCLQKSLNDAADKTHDEELKKLLSWAALHIEESNEALKNVREEVAQYQIELENCHYKMNLLKSVLSDSLDLIRLPVFEFETSAKDLSSFTNIMAANGVAPYTKKSKGWQDKKKKELPQLQFAI